VFGTPSAIVVHPDRTIATAVAQADTAVRDLVEKAAETARELNLRSSTTFDRRWITLDGRPVTLTEFLGQPLLLMFWNPGCGFCQLMLSELRRWETTPAGRAQRMLVISAGPIEDNRALQLQAAVVLDPELAASRHFGIPGTPSALLLDADGQAASEPLVGAPAIFARIGSTPALEPAPPAMVEQAATESRALANVAKLADDARPIKQSEVHDELVEEGIILYQSRTRQVLTLNGTAALVWEYCDGAHDVDAIVAELTDLYPDAADAERDVRALLDQLLNADMIFPEPSRAGDAVVNA
jgi:hypothetical protein